MNRPTRKRTHLLEKIANKEAREASTSRKLGKRTKRWRKAASAYEAVAS